jgi:hypothetical protein
MSSQTASANGNANAFEMIVIQAEAQQVDTDGDGRLETFSADYTVFADGTAEGVVYIGDEQIDIKKGDLSLTDDGNVSVSAEGVLVHEVGHWVGLSHELDLRSSTPGTFATCDGCDCIIWDIDTANVASTFQVSVQYYFR